MIAHTRTLVDRGREAHHLAGRPVRRLGRAGTRTQSTAGPAVGRHPAEGWDDDLPHWEPGSKAVATRARHPETCCPHLGPKLPELWGGSADLAGSNNTTMKGAVLGPPSISTEDWDATRYGRTLHFGIREHAMGAILNGIVLHGPTRPYGGTFLQFADYMRPAVRLAA